MQAKVSPRFKKPGMRDPRLIIGLFIILFSVLGVVGVVRVTNQTQPYYAVATDVHIGDPITADNLTVVDVRLAGSATSYIPADQQIAPGTVAKRHLAVGELLAATSITDQLQEGRRLVTLLKDQYAVAGFSPGDRVDIWVSPKAEIGSALGDPTAVAQAAEVHSIRSQESIIGGTGQAAVELWVDSEVLTAVLAATNNGSAINLVPSDYFGGE